LLQRGNEVPGGQSLQVAQGKDLANLRGLAAPGQQDLRGEPLTLAGLLIDAAVIHPWRCHLDRAGRGRDGAGPVAAVADHQPPTDGVLLAGQLGYVLVDLGLQRGLQHPASHLSAQSRRSGSRTPLCRPR
jgi:hypothetical protein